MSAVRYVRVLDLSDLPPGGGVPVEVDGRAIAVFNVDGRVYAIDNVCPHRGGPLVEGALQGTSAVCPWHRWQFDVATGRNPVNPELSVSTFAVRIEDGSIWISVEPPGGVRGSDEAMEENRT